MKRNSTLWLLQVFSWIMVLVGVALPVVARLEGEKTEDWAMYVMFAGFIGVFSHSIFKSMDERISELERSGRCTANQPPEGTR